MVPNHQPVILWGNQLAKIDRLKVELFHGTIISQAGATLYIHIVSSQQKTMAEKGIQGVTKRAAIMLVLGLNPTKIAI